MILPAGPYYPSTAASGSGADTAWTNPSDAEIEDGTSASANLSTLASTNYLELTNFGFSVPSTATIDGVYVEFLRSGGANITTKNIAIMKAGSLVPATVTPGTDTWPASLTWGGNYGGQSSLWGTTLTPADVNNSGFGVAISAYNPYGSSLTASIDAVRVTVYWHTGVAAVEKRYIYKVYASTGEYIGTLPQPSSPPTFTTEINSTGSKMDIKVPVSADVSSQPVSPLTDEDGNILTDEDLNILTDEGAVPIIALGSSDTNRIIKNGNRVYVWEYSYWTPQGKNIFSGTIERWSSTFGGSDSDSIDISVYSFGAAFDNYLVRGDPSLFPLDTSQTTGSSDAFVGRSGSHVYSGGQTFQTISSTTNIAMVVLYMTGLGPGTDCTIAVKLYTGPDASVLLGTATAAIAADTLGEVQFIFPSNITVTPGTPYFIEITCTSGYGAYYRYTSTSSAYTLGTRYIRDTAVSPYFVAQSGDIYFKTYTSDGATERTFSGVDPVTGMIMPLMNEFVASGGPVSYDAANLEATGTSVDYDYNTNTMYDVLRAGLSLSPSGYYYYVDPGESTLYFKRSSTTADVVLTKGRHINKLDLVVTIEEVINQENFTGGLIGANNLYRVYKDADSMSRYGLRLNRKTDNRVTVNATADAIGQGIIDESKDEQFSTTVVVMAGTMDITTLRPGLTVGFNGFGTFIESLVLQIARVEYTPSYVTLSLGTIPKRLGNDIDDTRRGLIALSTIDNPTSPS